MFYQVEAFSDKPFFGNPTAIILENPKDSYQLLFKENFAREMNLPITAFVSKSTKADFRIEFFSPKKQVPFSGHATLAAVWLLAELKKIPPNTNKINIETEKGIFPCEIHWEKDTVSKIFVTLKSPEFQEIDIDKQKLADILGIRTDKIESNEKLPLIVADVGSPKILVLISSKEMTDALVPKYDEIERLCRKHKATGLHLYTFDTYSEGTTCYTRQFEPLRGVTETAVSGLANGALAAFLVKEGFAPPGTIIIEQGESLDRNSRVEVKIEATKSGIKSVKIGGKAQVMFKIELNKAIKTS
ncbi:MAG: PhzF family phenazine biosynthesis protein [Candidatus Heimdallarchaeota archaeon]|nr:PhzF family phenazine biosynthesis protein [Candidatus Heimdallarchaeota archaeon]